MSRMSVDDHYDAWARRERLLRPEELEWTLPLVEFARTENHFTNWVLDLREPDSIGLQKQIVLLEEKLQKIPEGHRSDYERGIPECKKYYYRRFPPPRLTLRQFVVLAGKKISAFVGRLSRPGAK